MTRFLFRCTGGVLLLVLLQGFIAFPALAQNQPTVQPDKPNVRVTLGGTFQGRASYAWSDGGQRRERVGFGVRRGRLRVNAAIGERAGVALQVEGVGNAPLFLDIAGTYQVNKQIRLRFGRMTSAQPAAFQPTPHAHIDAVDRAAIASIWGSQTIGGDGRDFGLDARYETPTASATLFFSNGDGNWSRARGNVREGVTASDPTLGIENNPGKLAISFMGHIQPTVLPGLNVGGFVGYNGSENPNTVANEFGRAYISYAGHLYWGAHPGSQPFRLKADVISILYEDVLTFEQQTLGASVLGAVGLGSIAELFARAERYDDNLSLDDDAALYLTGGASLSLSALRGEPYYQERLTLAYSTRRPEADGQPDTGLIILQAQFIF